MKKVLLILSFLALFSCTMTFNQTDKNKEPNVPQNVTIEYDSDSDLFVTSWNKDSGVESYTIEYLINDNTDQWIVLENNISENTYSFTFPSSVESEYYSTFSATSNKSVQGYFKIRVKALNSGNSSDWSDEASILIDSSISYSTVEHIQMDGGYYKTSIKIENQGNVKIDGIRLGISIDITNDIVFQKHTVDTSIGVSDYIIFETDPYLAENTPVFEYCYLGFVLK